MPTYDYVCEACGHEFEHFVLRMSEASSTLACPTCSAVAERQISAGGGMIFKGSGFYITDYAKKESTPAGKTGGGRDKDSSSGSSSSESSSSSSSEASSGEKSSAPSTPAPATPAKTATTKSD